SGSSSVEDLETLFQLTHLQFTAPRLDDTGFALFKEQRAEAIRNRLKSPQTWFSDRYRELMWHGYLRYEPWNVVSLAAVDLEVARRFFTARFANAGDFTVALVGNTTPEQLEPFVTRYLASLPGDPKSKESPPSIGAQRNPESVSATVRRGLDPKAQARLTLHGPFKNTAENRYLLGAVVSLLSDRLREELREELGGTYSVSANDSLREHPISDYAVSVAFQCDPARVRELLERAKQVISQMSESPPSDEELQKLRAQQLRGRETALRTNGFWLSALLAYERRSEPLENILTYGELANSLTPKKVQESAKRWLTQERTVEVVLLPEQAMGKAR
ncbi:MAG: insulinase family protein, partial [Myxococcota bacterium]